MSKTPWVRETRPQFLLLAVLLVAHGAALAFLQQGYVDWIRLVLACLGLVLIHASVNVLNDWHDMSKTGIDKDTVQTGFSGGSGLLPAGEMSAKQALALGVGTLAAGSAIGLYLAWLAGWQLLAIGLVGVLLVVLYTPFFCRIGLGEIAAGLGLGPLPIVGTYFLLAGSIDKIAWVSGMPAFFLTYNLLLLNEFPDAAADVKGGRRHMVIMLGKRRARWLYVAVEVAAYLAIVAGVVFDGLNPWSLLGLGAGVFAIKAIGGAIKDYDSFEGLIPAQGANVGAVLITNLLMAVGYLIAALL